MEFHILGPLEVTSCGEPLPLGGPQQRALLALLVLHANESVRRERLIDEIWGETPPKTAPVSLNGYVSKLRKLLTNGSGAAVETRPDGYALRVEPEQLDVNRFERLVAEAREAKAGGRPREAEEALAAAFELWRGPPLADLAYAPFAQSEIARLEELRVAALEDRYELELEQGRHAVVVAELEKLANDHPLRERPVALLMLALYGSGRQAEALQVYERTRRLLAEELGLEPSELLRELQGRILRRDPELAPIEPAPRRMTPAAGSRALRPGRLLVALAVAAGAAAVAVAIGFGGSGHGIRVTANSLGVLDPATNRFIAAVPLGESPTLVAFGNGDAWVVNDRGRIVSRIDGAKRRVVDNVSAPAPVTGLAVAGGSIWLSSSGRIRRIDPAYNRLVAGSTRPCDGCGAELAAGKGALWTTDDFDTLARVNLRTGASRRAPAALVQGAHEVAAGAGGVWVAGDGVTRLDPRTLLPDGVPIPTGRVRAIGVGADAVWAAVGNRVVEINPGDNSVEASVPVGSNPSSIAVGGGAVWVANSSDGTISRIDPAKATVVDTIQVGPSPVGLAFGGGKLWVSAQ